jgi:CheY-like chemotaxis protein
MRNGYFIYVDDDDEDIQLIKEAFADLTDHKLVTFYNSSELFLFLKTAKHFPSLIILDINMPGLNGHETLRLLKEHARYSAIPVVLFSTGRELKDLQFAERYKTDIILKPFNPKELNKSVQKIMDYA